MDQKWDGVYNQWKNSVCDRILIDLNQRAIHIYMNMIKINALTKEWTDSNNMVLYSLNKDQKSWPPQDINTSFMQKSFYETIVEKEKFLLPFEDTWGIQLSLVIY